jgi:hypothetical protein
MAMEHTIYVLHAVSQKIVLPALACDLTSFITDSPHSPACCVHPLQLIEAALPKLPRIPGVTAHWLAINGVQPDLPENSSAGPLPKKRRQPLGLPGQGSRLGSLQEAAAAAAAAAVAGAVPGAD